jgi:hypothetical protein
MDRGTVVHYAGGGSGRLALLATQVQHTTQEEGTWGPPRATGTTRPWAAYGRISGLEGQYGRPHSALVPRRSAHRRFW